MTEYLPFVVLGLTTGSVYAIAAMGLVLTYKTSALFNFAHGSIAAAAACVFYSLNVNHGWPWPLAGLAAVVGAGVVGGLLLERIAVGLAGASVALKIVGMVGVSLLITGVITVIYGTQARDFPKYLPKDTVRFPGVNVGVDQLIMVSFALVLAGALYVLFRFSRTGTAMRAVVDNPGLLDLSGTSPNRVRRVAWLVGTTFAAMSGVLLAPSIGLNATVLTLLVVQAFGAAAAGAFTSLPLAYAGGLVVGLLSEVSKKVVADYQPSLIGLPTAMPFIVLFIVLLLYPKARLVEVGQFVRTRSRPTSVGPAGFRAASTAAVLAGGLFVPQVVGTKLPLFSNALGYTIIFLSLSLLVRTSGQVSLCQIGFVAVGAATFANLIAHDVPWLVAVVVAGLATVPLGAVLAIPAIRLSGLYLALATYGFGILLAQVVYSSDLLFGGAQASEAPRPDVLGLDKDKGYYYVLLAAVVCLAALVVVIERGRLGRLLRALSDSPLAMETHGASPNVTRVIVFCVSAFVAGVGGALLGPLSGFVNASAFDPSLSLILLAVLAIAGRGTVVPAFVAAAAYIVVPGYISAPTLNEWLVPGFGAAALVAAMAGGGATRGYLGRFVPGALDRLRTSPVRLRVATAMAGPADHAEG